MSEKAITEKDKMKKVESLPEWWKRVRLGDVIEEVKDRKGRRNVSTVLTVSNVEGLVDQTDFFGRNLSSENSSKYKIVEKWYFVYNPARINVGSIGLNNLYDLAIVSPMYSVFRTKDKLLPKYLYFWTQLPIFRNMVINNTAGSVRESLNFSRLINFDFLLPPLPEQQKIAEILETVDNAIEKTDAIIEKYRRIKKGLMADLLTGKIRLIPYGHSEAEGEESPLLTSPEAKKFVIGDKTFVAVPNQKWKNSPIGKIPADWKFGLISDFDEINPKVPIKNNQLYPFIEMDAVPVMGKNYNYLTFRKGSESGSEFQGGDILIARITPCAENGKALLVPSNIDVGIGSTEFFVFRAKQGVNNVFLFYLLISDYVRPIAISLMEGTSGRQRIPRYAFESVIKVAIPSSNVEQQLIADVLSQVDEVIEKEIKYKEKLERIKKGLMEDLLTGKVRVDNLMEVE
jgi:type I restriction enzyme S subunit